LLGGNSYKVGLSPTAVYLENGRSGSGNSLSVVGLKYSADENLVEYLVARGEALAGRGLRRTEMTECVEDADEKVRDLAAVVADCACEYRDCDGFLDCGRGFGRCWFSCGRMTGVVSVKSDELE
jgi:hypothetical protein